MTTKYYDYDYDEDNNTDTDGYYLSYLANRPPRINMTTTNGSFEGCVHPQWIGDSFCDDGNNNQGCDFDGGDCCGNYVKKHYCEKCECIDWDELPYYSFNGFCWSCEDVNFELIKVEALCDCDDVVKAVYASTPLKTKSGRTSWEIGRIRQMLTKKEVCRVKWLEGKTNPADVFTKRGAPKHLMLRTLEFGVC